MTDTTDRLNIRLTKKDQATLAKLARVYPGLKIAQITRLAWARLLKEGHDTMDKSR